MVQQEASITATSPQFFGRIFPNLPPFVNTADTIILQHTIDVIRDVGEFTHVLDAKDVLEKGPTALIADRALSNINQNNPNHTAGTTFFGQFLDHDLTFDNTSRLAVVTDPDTTRNMRNAALAS